MKRLSILFSAALALAACGGGGGAGGGESVSDRPILLLSSGSSGTVVYEGEYAVRGATETGALVTVNGVGVVLDANGQFYTVVSLVPGNNTITITATASIGSMTVEFDVYYDSGVPTIWYVDADATSSTEDGTTWQTAFRQPQDGVDAANAGDQVWVAAGIYTWQPHAWESVITMKENVEIYGGFSGVETLLDQRDVVQNATVLDGEQVSIHVVAGADNSRLDGFTITGGNADISSSGYQGGGMLNDRASPTVANCIFEDNYSKEKGAAVFNVQALPRFINVTFTGNSTDGDGGAMYNDTAFPTLTGCTLEGNQAGGNGGGIYNTPHTAPTIAGTAFSGNQAALGGAIYNDNAFPVISTCTFSANSLHAVTSYDGGPRVSGSTFNGHPGSSGMWNKGSDAEVTGGLFRGHSTHALYSEGGTTTVTGTVFDSNSASAVFNTGNTLYMDGTEFTGNSAALLGGGVYSNLSEVTVLNASFMGNFAGSGGSAIWAENGPLTLSSTVFDQNGGVSAVNLSGDLLEAVNTDFSANSGRGLLLQNVTSRVDGCTFLQNSSMGLYAYYGQTEVAESDFNDNGSYGLYSYNNRVKVDRSTFINNFYGLYLAQNSDLRTDVVSNSLFSGNNRGIYEYSPLFSSNVNTLDVDNSSFASNVYGLYLHSTSATYRSLVYVNNSILWGNGTEIYRYLNYTAAYVNYSTVEGGYSGTGNVGTDPNFVDADGADNVPGTIDDDLHLAYPSSAIDAGSNSLVSTSLDLDGNPRLIDDPVTADTGLGTAPIVDMGAYEYVP